MSRFQCEGDDRGFRGVVMSPQSSCHSSRRCRYITLHYNTTHYITLHYITFPRCVRSSPPSPRSRFTARRFVTRSLALVYTRICEHANEVISPRNNHAVTAPRRCHRHAPLACAWAPPPPPPPPPRRPVGRMRCAARAAAAAAEITCLGRHGTWTGTQCASVTPRERAWQREGRGREERAGEE